MAESLQGRASRPSMDNQLIHFSILMKILSLHQGPTNTSESMVNLARSKVTLAGDGQSL